MKLRFLSLIVCALFAIPGCADSVDSERSALDNNTSCSNAANLPCYCITDQDCPTGTYCQIADSPPPPFQGICIKDDQLCYNAADNSTVCCNASEANCPPPAPGCSNTDPNCAPPPTTCSNTDPNCAPPPGCNAGDPNCH